MRIRRLGLDGELREALVRPDRQRDGHTRRRSLRRLVVHGTRQDAADDGREDDGVLVRIRRLGLDGELREALVRPDRQRDGHTRRRSLAHGGELLGWRHLQCAEQEGRQGDARRLGGADESPPAPRILFSLPHVSLRQVQLLKGLTNCACCASDATDTMRQGIEAAACLKLCDGKWRARWLVAPFGSSKHAAYRLGPRCPVAVRRLRAVRAVVELQRHCTHERFLAAWSTRPDWDAVVCSVASPRNTRMKRATVPVAVVLLARSGYLCRHRQ